MKQESEGNSQSHIPILIGIGSRNAQQTTSKLRYCLHQQRHFDRQKNSSSSCSRQSRLPSLNYLRKHLTVDCDNVSSRTKSTENDLSDMTTKDRSGVFPWNESHDKTTKCHIDEIPTQGGTFSFSTDAIETTSSAVGYAKNVLQTAVNPYDLNNDKSAPLDGDKQNHQILNENASSNGNSLEIFHSLPTEHQFRCQNRTQQKLTYDDSRQTYAESPVITSGYNERLIIYSSTSPCTFDYEMGGYTAVACVVDNISISTKSISNFSVASLFSSTFTSWSVPIDIQSQPASSYSHSNNLDYSILGRFSPLPRDINVTEKCVEVDAFDCETSEDNSIHNADPLCFVFGRPVSEEAVAVTRCLTPPAFFSVAKRTSTADLALVSSDRKRTAAGEHSAMETVSSTTFSYVLTSSIGNRSMTKDGRLCHHCDQCLAYFKRQIVKYVHPEKGIGIHRTSSKKISLTDLDHRLTMPECLRSRYQSGRCRVCSTPVCRLRQAAYDDITCMAVGYNDTTMSHFINPATSPFGSQSSSYRCAKNEKITNSIPVAQLSNLRRDPTVKNDFYNSVQDRTRPTRQQMNCAVSKIANSTNGVNGSLRSDNSYRGAVTDLSNITVLPTSELNSPKAPRFYVSNLSKERSQGCSSSAKSGYGFNLSASISSFDFHSRQNSTSTIPTLCGATRTLSTPATPSSPNSAAVSFFHRAAQKMSKKKKKLPLLEPELPIYPTVFAHVISMTPPPVPPSLLRSVARTQIPYTGKVKVMLKVSSNQCTQMDTGSRFISIDPHRKQITIFDPAINGYVTSANRRSCTSAPKMFAFDAVFSPDDSLTEVCVASLSEIIQAVVGGVDGCLFTYGYDRTGKTHTMLGTDHNALTLGVMPCAISWLFKLIDQQKDKTGARFSVRVSAVEVSCRSEKSRDLLAKVAQGTESTGVGTAPGVYLQDDPVCGAQFEHQSELRAPSAEQAALYLDAALAARSSAEDEITSSHFLFTLNVYQYRIEKENVAGFPGVAGGRSRLHLIDFGNSSRSRDQSDSNLSISSLGNVIVALLNGQRHLPYRDSRISQLLRDSLGNVTCRTCMLAHVSSAVPHYNETLQVVQLASRLYRMKRRKAKLSSTSSEDSSTDDSGRFRRPFRGMRMGILREEMVQPASHSDPDCTSSSEQSCDTVIYLGGADKSLSDRELTDNEGLHRHVPRTNPRLPRRHSGSKSSGDDSDSGRSRTSDNPYSPLRSGMGMRLRSPLKSASSPSTPVFARVQSPLVHKVSAPTSPSHTKLMTHRSNKCYKPTSKVIADGTNTVEPSYRRPPDKICRLNRAKIFDKTSEQWVDGPNVSVYQCRKSLEEQWVDGPTAFLVQKKDSHLQDITKPLENQTSCSSQHGWIAKYLKNYKVEANEQWIDGPREMMICNGSGTEDVEKCNALNIDGKPMPFGASSQTSQVSTFSVAVNEKALKEALMKHLENAQGGNLTDNDCKAYLANATNITNKESGNSSADHKSCLEVDGVCNADSGYNPDVKSFVFDCSSCQPDHETHNSDSFIKQANNFAASQNQFPIVSMKSVLDANNMWLQTKNMPCSDNPNHRVAQWIKSVSTNGDVAANSELFPAQYYTDICMKDAETNTELDSEFEHIAARVFHSESHPCYATELVVNGDNRDGKLDIGQNSFYELNVEEELENLPSRIDVTLLAKDVDDETFSFISTRDSDDLDREESALVQHSKILTERHKNDNLEIEHMDCHKFPVNLGVRKDNLLLNNYAYSLCRKADWASSPLFECHIENSEECIFSETNNDYPQQVVASLGLTDDFNKNKDKCVVSSQSFYHRSDCKMANYSKPPLPQKSRATFTNNSLEATSVMTTACLSSSKSVMTTACLSSSKSVMTTACLSSSRSTNPLGIIATENCLPTKLTVPTNKQLHSKNSAIPVFSKGYETHTKNTTIDVKDEEICTSYQPTFNSSLHRCFPSQDCLSTVITNEAVNCNKVSISVNKTALNLHGLSVASAPCKDINGQRKDSNSGKVFRDINDVQHLEDGQCHKEGKTTHASTSGNDGSIVAHNAPLTSPYATVTDPRTPSHSSSGHGSDNSSLVSADAQCAHITKACALKCEGTSSGYESMLRDSDGTVFSDPEDDGCEKSSQKYKSNAQKGSKKSRSLPPRHSASLPCSGTGSEVSKLGIDTHGIGKSHGAVDVTICNVDDLEHNEQRTQKSNLREKPTTSNCVVNGVLIKQPLVHELRVKRNKECVTMHHDTKSINCRLLMCFCKNRPPSPVLV